MAGAWTIHPTCLQQVLLLRSKEQSPEKAPCTYQFKGCPGWDGTNQAGQEWWCVWPSLFDLRPELLSAELSDRPGLVLLAWRSIPGAMALRGFFTLDSLFLKIIKWLIDMRSTRRPPSVRGGSDEISRVLVQEWVHW